MSRFHVTASDGTESELADLILNSPPSLARDVTLASDQIDQDLEDVDLLLGNRGMRGIHQIGAHRVYPLIAVFEIDHATNEVNIIRYKLAIGLFRP